LLVAGSSLLPVACSWCLDAFFVKNRERLLFKQQLYHSTYWQPATGSWLPVLTTNNHHLTTKQNKKSRTLCGLFLICKT